ncbi:hypothetical protein BS50DRAFT_569083 [Corynespora cassiicola Philippines]|uniref:Uncharacterized protein n=1 Tax=Corynespora cassiicola Philippines TaxID=1448308 RepID=A0A2T2P866_CORCC|nr:hypothetical protein BS50DRAFT_569083 [Corynespora cassiicola Philippines]
MGARAVHGRTRLAIYANARAQYPNPLLHRHIAHHGKTNASRASFIVLNGGQGR